MTEYCAERHICANLTRVCGVREKKARSNAPGQVIQWYIWKFVEMISDQS